MARSSEKRQMPRTEEVALMAAEAGSVESLAGTILLDRYRLIKLLGSGGAAAVYKAEHSIMHKPLAVKVLRPECAVREEFVRRFIGEARMVAKLRHEHIVDVIDIGRTEGGIVFCVMEYLEGETLADTLLRDGPMPLARAQAMTLQICSALAAAHAVNVVHRDVKPENCIRIRHAGNADFIKLLDFGIAKQLDAATGLTNTGVIMGTAEYMSPEQARGSSGVDARADIYSVGAMLFELLTGLPPFMGDSFLDVLLKHSTEPIPKICMLVPGLPPAMDLVMERALAKKPADRFAGMEEFVAALATVGEATVLAPSPIRVPVTPRPSLPLASLAEPPPPSVPENAAEATMQTPMISTGPLRAPPQSGTRAGLAVTLVVATILAMTIVIGVLSVGTGEESKDEREGEPIVVAVGAQPMGPGIERKPAPHPVEARTANPDVPARTDARAPMPRESLSGPDSGIAPREAAPEIEDLQAGNPEGHSLLDEPGTRTGEQREAKPRPEKAPNRAVERQLATRIRSACSRFVFEPKTVLLLATKGRPPSVTVSPHYDRLQRCILATVGELAVGRYRFRLEPRSLR